VTGPPAARYPGGELALFAAARRWKAYLATLLGPLLRGVVVEVGAGLGATTAALADGRQQRWLCLEPDPGLAAALRAAVAAGRLPAYCEVQTSGLEGLSPGLRADAILYLDVLEHIADDAGELARAAAHLAPGGALVVLAPAHPWLYSAFDAAIGHHRRYTRRTLDRLAPPGLARETVRYLDSAGLLASAGNRLLLRRALPTPGQIAAWDGWLVPLSRWLDPRLGFRAGKSVLAVWRRGS
jgi:SAM-dependent methyltransferase